MAYEDHNAGPPDAYTIGLLQAALHRYCLSLTRSAWDAEDLAQDTWVKARDYWQQPENLNMEALLLRIARNTWIDVMRRQTAFGKILQRLRPEAGSADKDTNASSELETAFQALVEHLSPLQRTVFLLRDVLGLSAREAADRLKITEGAVKAALHRARLRLPELRREWLADGPQEPGQRAYRLHLQRLAAAYEQGQIAELIRLAMLDNVQEQESVVAVSVTTVHAAVNTASYPTAGWSIVQPEMRLAA